MSGYRYLRALATSLDTGTPYCACAKIEFHATPGSADLCAGATMMCDSNFSGLPASNANDANINTHWASNGTGVGAWLGVDLGVSTTSYCQEIKWTVRNDVSFRQAPTSLKIQGSNNLFVWDDLFIVSSITWASAGTTQTFTGTFGAPPLPDTYIMQQVRMALLGAASPVTIQHMQRLVLSESTGNVFVNQLSRLTLRSTASGDRLVSIGQLARLALERASNDLYVNQFVRMTLRSNIPAGRRRPIYVSMWRG